MSRNQQIKDDAANRRAAWTNGPQSEHNGPNTLVLSTPTNHSSQGNMPLSGRVNNSIGNFGGGALNTSIGGGMMMQQQQQGAPALDGPLPKEARMLIQAAVTGEEADQAELYARRLLSTSRRVRIYKEELQAAREEVDDYKGVVTQQQLVVSQLGGEASQIQQRIMELQNELHMCQMQQEQAMNEQRRMEGKQFEAQRRVDALQNTIDTIASESQRGKLLLRQLVPNLNIDNYAN